MTSIDKTLFNLETLKQYGRECSSSEITAFATEAIQEILRLSKQVASWERAFPAMKLPGQILK